MDKLRLHAFYNLMIGYCIHAACTNCYFFGLTCELFVLKYIQHISLKFRN